MDRTSEEKERHQKALALIICLFIGFMYVETIWKPYFFGLPVVPPQPAATEATAVAGKQPAQTIPNYSEPGVVAAPLAEVSSEPRRDFPSDSQVQDAGVLNIKTETFEAELSLLGGRLSNLLLTQYALDHIDHDARLNLVKHIEFAPLPLGVYSGGVHDAWTSYSASSNQGNLADSKSIVLKPGDEPAVVNLTGVLPDGRTITKAFTFHPEGYVVDTQVQLSAPAADGGRLELEWNKFAEVHETSFLDPYDVQETVWFDGERALSEALPEISSERLALGDVRWLAVADKYFFAAMVNRNSLTPGQIVRNDRLYRLRLAGEPTELSAALVLGPKKIEYLEQVGFELHRVLNFGRLSFISVPLLSLLHAFYRLFGNYGLAIVVLTILVKICLYPLNSASFKQMKAMQDLKPEIDRIRKDVSDKQQQQVELMALYKKRGVNPIGGCLPILIQMPIFIGLYYALMGAVELRGANFALWINDLSAPESLMVAGIGIPVMVILFVISMIWQQATTPSAMDPTQKKVMMVMPVVMGFMFANFAAGLTLYWLTNNLISIGQQKALHHYDTKRTSAFMLTLGVSAAVFALAFLVTRF